MSIRDPIHGMIQVTDIERRILRVSSVARMRWIKQMGLASLVFPGANHTRFEHSLGTMYVADALAGKLLQSNHKQLDQYTIQEIRLSALLHDIGHTPFSHVVEGFFERFPKYVPKTEQYDHETYTIEIVRNDEEIKAACSEEPIDLSFVSRLAVGKSGTCLDSLISSSLDVDKIDYVVRDSYYCGLPYGNVDLLSLSDGIRLDTRGEVLEIAFDESSRDACEGLLTSRYYLMTSVHYHNDNCAANLLLFKAIAEAYDDVLEVIADTTEPDIVKRLLAQDMHFKWVDHDLITFLRSPLEALRLSILHNSHLARKTRYALLESIENENRSSRKRPRSSVLLDRVLRCDVPRNRLRYSFAYFPSATRYDLYLILRFAKYTNHFADLQNNIKRLLKLSEGRDAYIDLIFPRVPVINTMISSGNGEKYLYDVSLLMRSLVSQSATRLALHTYSFKKLDWTPNRRDLEAIIRSVCRRVRSLTVERQKWIGTDILLLIYYYIHEFAGKSEGQAREFFKGDTRFQAFCGELLHNVLPKRTYPYPEIEKIRHRYGNLNEANKFESFRRTGYPEFYSVALVQDLDLLSEMGLLYTRSGTVPIYETGEYQRRYERRISRQGREYVSTYVEKAYPFSQEIGNRVKHFVRAGVPLIDMGS